jgi:manganese transport protein
MAMMLQYLSGKLGIATGKSLPEIIRERLKKKIFIMPYWLAAEAAAATDLAEYLGTVIALNLLFGIPLIYAAIFGALDVILILALTTRRFRVLEQMFILFVSIIGFGFLYEVFITKPDPSAILFHSFVPILANSNALLISVGIIGATVMPHALFVHSWLTKSKIKDKSIQEKRTLRKIHLTETVVILTIAGMVNAAIMIIAAAAFHAHFSNI